MAMSLPYKSLLLKSFKEKNEQWEYDAVKDLMASCNLNSDYWKYNARFWLMELQTCGLIEIVEQDIDDGTHYSEGRILTKYKVTGMGLDRIQNMLE